MNTDFEDLPPIFKQYRKQPKFLRVNAQANAHSLLYRILERYVPPYVLPDLFLSKSGQKIVSIEEWENIRRDEILDDFRTYIYGKSPISPNPIQWEVVSEEKDALNGCATRIEIKLWLVGIESGPKVNLLLYLPNQIKGKVPIFVGLNFFGNHTIHSDPGITLNPNWVNNNVQFKILNHRCGEHTRGVRAHRWQVEYVLSQGYGLATAYYGDITPDCPQGRSYGVHRYFHQKGLSSPSPDEWGAVGSWAWGLSRIMDYLEKNARIDPLKVAVMGHSRLGKTALWAGAQDKRFALVISNDSGCTGAALSRRHFGETVQLINNQFPHWFCDNYKAFNEREYALPVDQHMLLALIAPRPLYVASAMRDLWADPKGEYLSAKHATPVYELYGKKGIGQAVPDLPSQESPIMNQIGHHLRKGGHDVTRYDWTQFIRFMNMHLNS
jgi:hypothetical protein